MTTEGAAAGARTFLIADIRGYTAYTAEHGDDAAAALANRFADLTREVAEAFEGFIIELRGDEALCAFVSARQALRAALAMQERYRADELPRGVGIGIDSGEAIPMESGGFRGTALNLAARLCAHAKPGQIIASEAVIHLAARVDGIAYVESRTIRLKGYDDPVRAVDVVPVDGARVRRGPSRRLPPVGKGVLIGGAAALLAVALGAVALSGAFSPRQSAPPGATSTSSVAAASHSNLPVTDSPAASASTGPPTTPSSGPSIGPSPGASEGPIPAEALPALVFLDPATGELTSTQAAIPGQTDTAAFVDGAFWQFGITPKAFYTIDPATHAILGTVASPIEEEGWVTVSDGILWITDLTKPRVVGIDVATGSVIHDFFLSDDPSDDTRADGVAVGAGSLWVALPDERQLVRLDPTTGSVQKRIDINNVDILAFGNGALWTTSNGRITRIDPATNEATSTTLLATERFFPYMTFSPNATWTADEVDGSVYKIDRAGAIQGRYQVGLGARPLQYMDGKVWVGAQDAGIVSAIDANTGHIDSYPIGHQLTAVAAGNGMVMIGVKPSPEDIFAGLDGKVLTVALTQEALQAPAPDPASGPRPYNRMILYATCARLLDYGDEGGTDSYSLRPEVAMAMPDVSPDGLTYTFTIREGFAFSPPDSEPITAETYRYSMERALSASLGDDGPRALEFWSDIVGATEFHDGQADHVAGLQAADDKLTITLSAPSPNFLARLALPFGCPVPLGTPALPNLDPITPVPTSGPYYLADHGAGEYAILRKNPNYGGSRPQNYDAIALRFGLADFETVGWVDDGRADVAISDAALQAGLDIATNYGPDSDAAAAGDQRWYPIPYPGIDYLALNPAGSLTGEQSVRQAIALALDRGSASQSFFELGATSILNSVFPVRDPEIPELLGPDPNGARALLAGKSGTIRMAVQDGCDLCLDSANAIKSSLALAGLTLELVPVEDTFGAADDAKSKIDMLAAYAQPFFPDAAQLLRHLVGNGPEGWFTDEQIAQADGLVQLAGAEREQASADFAHTLALDARVIPYGVPIDGVYFGQTVGCRTIIAGIMNVDLVALCPAT